MQKFERQCKTCGLIYDLNHWVPEKTWECPYCRNLAVKGDSKAIIKLKKMKRKLGVVGS